ncbi:MAG: adenylyltransferase/cytidyltransferase family protein [Planctomycetes bacterium]|nr:adenylyltransferase/cytidyltransferase family protein [Planctomycetota bacterium]
MSASASSTPPAAKVLSRDRLLSLRLEAGSSGRTLVQCHGCFDIVHPGHIRHLRHARSLGDILLVTISGDVEVGKGIGRPLIPEELRAENLAALDCVDWVHIDRGPTAVDLLNAVKPDVFVKGKEYETNNDPRFNAERHAVESHGGRVVFSSGDVVFSSTALIAAIESSVDPFHARLAELSGKPELESPGLFALLAAGRGRRVLVVGETIIDEYVLCDRPDVAGEGPILSLRPLDRRRYDAGAAIVARHLAALGAHPVLITPLPDNDDAAALVSRLEADGIEVRSLTVSARIPTKQRFLVGAQKVVKIDLVEPIEMDAAGQDQFVDLAASTAAEHGGYDAAILTDFALGMFTPTIMARLCRRLRPVVRALTGDVSGRRAHLRDMRQMDLICPSEHELRDAVGYHDQGLTAVVWRLLEETASKAALVTLGPEGLIAFDRLPESHSLQGDRTWRTRLAGEHIPAMVPYAVDPLGCGDALLAVATLALVSGGSIMPSAFLGAAAAAVQAQRLGNLPVSAPDLRRMVTRVQSAHLTYSAADVLESATIPPSLRRLPPGSILNAS